MIKFKIVWYTRGNDVRQFTIVECDNLTDAIAKAARLILQPRGDQGALEAHGFKVCKVEA